jgi:endoglycosylceramidase
MKKVIYLFAAFLFLISCKKETSTQEKLPNVLFAKRGNQPGIFDAQGRFVILRGANYNVLGDYWQANPAIATVKDYSENDFKMMAVYGFNCVRLVFNWSALEPVRGQYNQVYIDRIKKAIEDAAKYNIYILLDMHQDAYGKYIVTPQDVVCDYPNKGWDGAPEWATFTDGASTCTNNGSRESPPAVFHAWQNFWDNKDSIQDACLNAWSALVKQTAKYDNVLGYDLINEPSLGYESIEKQAKKISVFYNNLIKKIRIAENEVNSNHHIAMFEMTITWNGQEIPFVPLANFTDDQNIVFAPHTYFESITYLLTVEQGYDLIKNLSKLYNTIMFIGEYGFFNDPAVDVAKLKRFAKKEDDNFTSSTIWQWAHAPGDPHAISWDGLHYSNTAMQLIETDVNGNFTGNNNEYFLNVLSRTRPNAIVGYPSKLMSNPDNGNMYLEATTDKSGITEIWIPNRFGTPKITGSNATLQNITNIEGGYIAKVEVQKNYTIEVSF